MVLASGQLVATTPTAIYTAPRFSTVKIKNIVLTNKNSTTETLNISLVIGGNAAKQLSPKDATLTAGQQAELGDQGVKMTYGDVIKGSTTTGSMVDYLVIGEVG